jgi:hypothetical protein
MAGRGNPSFIKNQKARKRVEKAAAKRADRQARRQERAASHANAAPAAELTDRVDLEIPDASEPPPGGAPDPNPPGGG